jgi:outer membrane lipoprotein-sorting protein
MRLLGFAAAVALASTSGVFADPAPAATPNPPAAQTSPPVALSPTAEEIVEKSKAVYAALSSYACTGHTDSGSAAFSQTTTFSMRLQRPGFYWVNWQSPFSSGSVWSDGTGDFLNMTGQPQKMKDREMALASATGISSMAAATIPGTFFQEAWGNTLNPVLPAERQPDEKIDSIDCFVVTTRINPSKAGASTTTLWIGREDALIHQCRMVITQAPQPKLTDDQIAEVLKAQNKPATPQTVADTKKLMAEAMKQADAAMRKGPIIFTEKLENIVANQKFVPADFTHP